MCNSEFISLRNLVHVALGLVNLDERLEDIKDAPCRASVHVFDLEIRQVVKPVHQSLSDLTGEKICLLLFTKVWQFGELRQDDSCKRQWEDTLLTAFDHLDYALESIDFAKEIGESHRPAIFLDLVSPGVGAFSDVFTFELCKHVLCSGVLAPNFAEHLDQLEAALGDGGLDVHAEEKVVHAILTESILIVGEDLHPCKNELEDKFDKF